MPHLEFTPDKTAAADLRLVLAATNVYLPQEVHKDGFHPFPGYSVHNALRNAGLWFGPRNLLEQLPMFRQVIPYTVLVSCRDGGFAVLAYTRTSQGGEDRLHNRVSIGVGGHIDITDVNPEVTALHADGKFDLEHTLDEASHREIREELGELHDFLIYAKWAGLVVDSRTEVSRVHIGVVRVWYMSEAFRPEQHTDVEDALTGVAFRTPQELLADPQLEDWSRILLENTAAWL